MGSPQAQSSTLSHRMLGLDSLRAHMMLLGVVFHAALSYTPVPPNDIWPIRDEASDVLFSSLVSIISTFRMPVFFIVAGLFFCLLQERRGLKEALLDRTRRIAFPFLLLVPAMFALCGTGFLWAIDQLPSSDPLRITFEWRQLYHLWFLYFLIFFYGLSTIIAPLLRRFVPPVRQASEISLFRGLAGWTMGLGIFAWVSSPLQLQASVGFIPNSDTFFYYGIFFFLGYWLYRNKALLPLVERRFWLFGILCVALLALWGVATIVYKDAMKSPNLFAMTTLAGALITFCFAIISGYLRWGKHESRIKAYLSSASYWVYLIHLPLVIWICNALSTAELNAYLKLTLNVSLTLAGSLASYHFFVRNSWIGILLNGKKQLQSKPIGQALLST